eukprot:CAMPEP_0118686898 /NCGR_PEP_ID=MMETSP0800-20121206/8075_1 /TAXON_ID=210618 ORGANISM="Striatella unipunctata, Strain CCMP2910" /NCGR_SAMPLE_ID=MMETSP0800 /ASSEMBLY_ACC=CAM_ASM_000638 /LENGTH=406 /DNA_ID=CAMNT_0006584007 /DNA_START=601 /DNA_END=1821 /DNA_ORIENTATION=+
MPVGSPLNIMQLHVHKGGPPKSFPLKLHEMLGQVERAGMSDIVSWKPHGRCFMVHKSDLFVKHILPLYFKQSKWSSFQRQVNIYGFTRLTEGKDKGSYYHKFFLKGHPELAPYIVRMKVKGTKVRVKGSNVNHPDFYTLPPIDSNTIEQLREEISRDLMAELATHSGIIVNHPTFAMQHIPPSTNAFQPTVAGDPVSSSKATPSFTISNSSQIPGFSMKNNYSLPTLDGKIMPLGGKMMTTTRLDESMFSPEDEDNAPSTCCSSSMDISTDSFSRSLHAQSCDVKNEVYKDVASTIFDSDCAFSKQPSAESLVAMEMGGIGNDRIPFTSRTKPSIDRFDFLSARVPQARLKEVPGNHLLPLPIPDTNICHQNQETLASMGFSARDAEGLDELPQDDAGWVELLDTI